MKKVFSVLFAVILLMSCIFIFPSSATYNSALETPAEVAFLMSLDDGTVIFDKNADKEVSPAALTKIVTAILTIENCKDLDVVIPVKKSCITALNGTGSPMANLLPDEEVSIRALLNCMLVRSANEAAMVLADYVGDGSIPNFIEMMNTLATSLGCEHTHFENPHGLDNPNQYSTARDLAKITQHALTLPVFSEITNTVTYKMPPTNKHEERNLLSTNWMINPNFKTYYYSYAEGIKTGSSGDAGHCIISKASKDGYNYLGIIMGAPEEDINGDGHPDNLAFIECKKMFKWAFQNIRLAKIADPLEVTTVRDVALSWKIDHVRLVPEKEVSALVPIGTDSTSVMMEVIPEETPETLKAPIKKGEVVGKARILYAEEEIATVNLVAAEDVDLSVPLWIGHIIKTIFRSMAFRIIFGIILLVLVIYLLLLLHHNQKKKRRRVRVVRNVRNVRR